MADNNNNQVLQQDGNVDKPKKSKKKYFIIGGVSLFVILLIVANVDTKNKEKKALEESSLAELSEMEYVETTTEVQLSDAEREQIMLAERLGEPPAGFRWSSNGELVAISDENLTAEEVVYQYLRSVSLLDIANAQKYSQHSSVLSTYDSYYSNSSSTGYYTQFARKLYAQVLTSMEVLGTEREVVFADGRRIYTMNIRLADLSYKDFWKDNQEEIFNQLRLYNNSESDNVKAQQYVFDLILEYFSREDCLKRDVQIDIVLDKVTLGGWLVSDDMDLDTYCKYTDGTSVYEYIFDCYSDWLREQQMKERQ